MSVDRDDIGPDRDGIEFRDNRGRGAGLERPGDRGARAIRRGSHLLGWLLLLLGLALLVRTATASSGGVATGYLIGSGFTITGAMRVWLARKGM